MSVGTQKVMVIQDASKDICLSAIRWVLQQFSLKLGDELILLGVLHQVNNPMGYKIKVDSGTILGSNPKIVEEEVAKKMEQYQKSEDLMELSKQCEMEKIKFHIEVHAGSPAKAVGLQAARSLPATWVILDRQMKKDKKFFLEKLSCGISRMKRANNIEQIRGPKTIKNTQVSPARSTTSTDQCISYGEMIPESRATQKTTSGKEQGGDGRGGPPRDSYWKSLSLSKSSSHEQMLSSTFSSSTLWNTEVSSSSATDAKNFPMYYQDEYYYTTNTEQETAGEDSPFYVPESLEGFQNEASFGGSPNEQQKQDVSNSYRMGGCQPEEFENSICSVCKNRRPKIGWKKDFTYAELKEATGRFSPNNFLSEGGYGSVYRGELKNGLKIAVKQHKDASFQGDKEFESEVHILSKARHQNLVMLLGSCSEGTHRLLVYEYVCNGSLEKHLSGKNL
ncbi:unnamed protein product [Ilex paraguariensis]|uniref:non-specific serine/threonine protein kinase n=1 Tax=Ilex paraguariensis TaxID=185542 RepID=A0ABC8RAZ4_9AQUA